MTPRDRPSAYLRLTRPANLIIVGVSVAVGAAVGGLDSPEKALLAVVAGMLVAGGGNAINDYFDREIDRVNKPGRPLPLASTTPTAALVLGLGLLAGGWGASAWLGVRAFVLVSVWLVLLTAYSARLKRMGAVGNLTVSAVSASAFLLGGLVAQAPALSLIPAGFAFLFHLGREIIKDTQDLPGDAGAGVRSLAFRYGKNRALRMAAVVFVLLIVATPVPFLAGVYNRIYLIAVLVGVDLPLVYVVREILTDPSVQRLGRVSALLKGDMVIGIGSILAGSGVLV